MILSVMISDLIAAISDNVAVNVVARLCKNRDCAVRQRRHFRQLPQQPHPAGCKVRQVLFVSSSIPIHMTVC